LATDRLNVESLPEVKMKKKKAELSSFWDKDISLHVVIPRV
jgi:hypothetical protein